MNTQFHTPSFGDEFVDMQQQQTQSRRVRSMDSSLDEYHSANDETFGNTTIPLNNSSPSTVEAAPTADATSPSTITTTVAARKQLTTNSPTADPNEPAKPLSSYALFFRDTVSAIKQQNPDCSFLELSRIVSSMWDALDPVHKNVYQKKYELARNEYLKQIRTYRLQQMDQPQQQQQQQQVPLTPPHEQYNNNNNSSPLQTRPVVFTIAHSNSTDAMANNCANASLTSSPPQQQQQPRKLTLNALQQLLPNITQKQLNITTQQQPQSQQHIYNAHAQEENADNNVANLTPAQNAATVVASTATNPSPEQIQMLTEAGSVQKCIRDNCNKRAIINPDWEDEYCSNECVVIHCRNVFNAWVQSNLNACQ